MGDKNLHDAWSAGDSYEIYMGRWSRKIAAAFLDWLDAPAGADWLDIGCGTGALSQSVLERCRPSSLLGVDPSEGFVGHIRRTTRDDRARFEVAGAEALPLGDARVDVAASALVLNFVPDRVAALREMQRVVRPGGLVAFYVWDYPGGGMGFIDLFWKAAAALDASAEALDEAGRFPFCTRDGLAELCKSAGIGNAVVEPVEIPTVFPTFEDFWLPFTLGAGPAPGYVAKLDEAGQAGLQRELKSRVGAGGPVDLRARAWAAKALRA